MTSAEQVEAEVGVCSTSATRDFGAALGALLQQGDVVVLSGDLGAGKTVLAQGIGQALEVGDAVTSPTFVLVRSHRGRIALLHADMWRLETLEEMADLGIAQMVEDGGVAVVEWGERAVPVLGSEYLCVEIFSPGGGDGPEEIAPDGDERRRIRLRPAGTRWTARWQEIAEMVSRWSGGSPT